MSLNETIQHVLNAAVSADDGPANLMFAAMDRQGQVLVLEAAGKTSISNDEPVTPNSMFALYSFTKPITGIAVMQLVEAGKLDLDAPIDPILPELAAAEIWDEDGNKSAPQTKITLRMLLTHTSGLSYSFYSRQVKRWHEETGKDEVAGSIEGIKSPLIFEPGTRWHYGVGIDWAGEALMRVTGMDLDEYCKKHIFEPLELKDLTFHPTAEQKSRLVSLHERDSSGKLHVRDHYPFVNSHTFASGGGGLFGTITSYISALLPLVNGGVGSNGVRILKEETVTEMLRDQLSHLPGTLLVALEDVRGGFSNTLPVDKNANLGWGLTFQITKDALPTGRSAGSINWAGLANLFWAADPVKGIVEVLFSQEVPFGEMRVINAFLASEAAVYSSLS